MNELSQRALPEFSAATHRNHDPMMPAVPLVPGLRCQDHATFVAAAADERAFREYWAARGLYAMAPIVPERFPARHIAFSATPEMTVLCQDMVGLSVSDDPASPVNRLVALYGGYRVDAGGEVAVGRIQHFAFAVDGEYDMADIRAALTLRGVRFMTPILTFEDSDGAYLQQMFVACKVPFGPFVEIIKRGVGRGGEPFHGFNAEQIDTLYQHYDAYSRMLASGVDDA